VINLLLLGAGGALFWWLRRRSRQNRVQLVDEDEATTDVSTDVTDSVEGEEKPA
jgi:hypothetical protein